MNFIRCSAIYALAAVQAWSAVAERAFAQSAPTGELGRRFSARQLSTLGLSSCFLLACIAPGPAAETTSKPATTILYDQPAADNTARLVISRHHIKQPATEIFGYGVAMKTCELDEIRVEIQQPRYEPVLVSAYTCINDVAGGRVLSQPPTVLDAIVSRGRIVWAMAGWNAVAIWEANLVGEEPPANCRMLVAPWGAYGGVNWIDNTRAEVKLKLGPDGHLTVGVRDKTPSQLQPFSWYQEEPGTWAVGFKEAK